MSKLGRSGLGCLLTLGICLLALGCGEPWAPKPTLPPLGPNPQPNLLQNPDFVEGNAGWQAKPAARLDLQHDQAGFVVVAVDPSAGPRSAGWSQMVNVQPGGSYCLSYRVRTEALTGSADLRLQWYDGDGRPLQELGGVPASGDTAWTNYAWRWRAPDNAARARVSLGVAGATAGRAAFDEPSIAPDEAPLSRALIVDYGQETGRLRAFQQMDAGVPAAELWGLEGVRVRGVDVQRIFPDLTADLDDPQSYDFAAADAALAPAARSGVELLVQLEGAGRSHLSAARWAEVARHIVMHYNEAWAGGYRYGIRYWEVGYGPGEPPQEAGSPEPYYELLADTVATLKAHDPTLRVGGPGLTMTAHLPYLEGLLAYLAGRGIRPGFVSWPSRYAASPWTPAAMERRLEQLLERHGLADTEVIASEWEPLAGQPADTWPASLDRAVQLVAARAYWQDTRLSRAFLIFEDGQAALADAGGEPTALGQALRLMGQFGQTPLRLAAQGGDEQGFALLAGKSEDGKLVQIAIADSGSRSEEYRLGLGSFPPGFHFRVTEISQAARGQVVAAGSDEALVDGVLRMPWRSPAVHLIEITW